MYPQILFLIFLVFITWLASAPCVWNLLSEVLGAAVTPEIEGLLGLPQAPRVLGDAVARSNAAFGTLRGLLSCGTVVLSNCCSVGWLLGPGVPVCFREMVDYWPGASVDLSGLCEFKSKKFAKAFCHSLAEIHSCLYFWHEISRIPASYQCCPFFFIPWKLVGPYELLRPTKYFIRKDVGRRVQRPDFC